MQFIFKGKHVYEDEISKLVVDTNKGEWFTIEPMNDDLGNHLNISSNVGSIFILEETFEMDIVRRVEVFDEMMNSIRNTSNIKLKRGQN